jgi:hypothetical protein
MSHDVKARFVQVIEVEHIRGGADGEPLRPVKTYWDTKGNMLAEYDPLKEGHLSEATASRKFHHD